MPLVVVVTVALMVVSVPENGEFLKQKKPEEAQPECPTQTLGVFATCHGHREQIDCSRTEQQAGRKADQPFGDLGKRSEGKERRGERAE
jgi:hypothetical protein